jgi:cupin fold WbuC family metalloprotein
MRFQKINDEVLVAASPLVQISSADIETLKELASANPRQRIRICAHPNTEDRLHEMLIVHKRDAYVRPHKHLNKSESFHVIEGETDVIFFDEEGSVADVIRLGDCRSGHSFYYRLGEDRYHSLLIRSEFLVFHETTNGPFRREETVFPSWAPEEKNAAACAEFQARLSRAIAGKNEDRSA